MVVERVGMALGLRKAGWPCVLPEVSIGNLITRYWQKREVQLRKLAIAIVLLSSPSIEVGCCVQD